MAKAVAKTKKNRSEIKAIRAGPSESRATGQRPQGAEKEPGQAGAEAGQQTGQQGGRHQAPPPM